MNLSQSSTSEPPPLAVPPARLLSRLLPAFSPEVPAAQRARYRAGYLGLLLICLFAFFWRLGSVPLFDLDEALYVTCARQMVLTGDLVTPRLNSRPPDNPAATTVPFFEKPIMVYWLCAASMRLFGLSEWAARLPVACAALLATWLIVLAGTRWFGPRAGLLAGLVYALAPMTIVDARQMTTDGLLALWFLGTMLTFWGCHRAAQARLHRGSSPLLTLLFWVLCALAVLTKGAVGLLLPFLVLLVFLLLRRLRLHLPWRRRRLAFELAWNRWTDVGRSLAALRPVSGLLLFLVLAAPWHILIWKAGGRDAEGRTFVQEYVLRQHIGRFQGLDKVHNAPLPTYFLYFLLGFFPWSCFVPAAFGFDPARRDRLNHRDTETRRIHREEREESEERARRLAEKGVAEGGEYGVGEAEEARRFLLVWFWTIFIFFSLGAAKLPTYIVPAYPAAALLVGRWLDRALLSPEDAGSRCALRGGALAALITAAMLFAVAVIAPSRLPRRAAVPSSVAALAVEVTLPLLICAGIAWICFRWGGRATRWRRIGFGALIALPLLLVGIGCTAGYAVAARDLLGPYQTLAVAARADAEADVPVVYYHIIPRRPSMLYYGRYAPLERKDAPLLPYLRPFLTPAHPAADVITQRRTLDEELSRELADAPDLSARVLAETDGWVSLRIARQKPVQTR